MDERPSQTKTSQPSRLRPLDHLRPGERPLVDPRPNAPSPPDHDAGAAGGDATGSPAAGDTREHLEGSDQGPV